MKYLICVDDTDDLTRETSTGRVANLIAGKLRREAGASVHLGVTRHQLLLMEGVPYTSHNSAMCTEIEADLTPDEVMEAGTSVVRKEMAASACPGLCVCRPEFIRDREALIAFGRRAQKEILFKEEAHSLIEATDGLEGTELGGNGQGIIGALAGIGLRLSGSDGSFRGKIRLPQNGKGVCSGEFRREFGIDAVRESETGVLIPDEAEVFGTDFIKLFFRNYEKTAFVRAAGDGRYELISSDRTGGGRRNMQKGTGDGCLHFVFDNDSNECTDGKKTCSNCLYRRLTAEGFLCDFRPGDFEV